MNFNFLVKNWHKVVILGGMPICMPLGIYTSRHKVSSMLRLVISLESVMTKKESDKLTWLVYLLIDFICNISKDLLLMLKNYACLSYPVKKFSHTLLYMPLNQLCELEGKSDVIYRWNKDQSA